MATRLPQVDLNRQYLTIQEEIQEELSKLFKNSDYIMGKSVYEFEKNFADFCGVTHAVGVASGTAAIHLILHALDIQPGDEIITVPHTFIATVEPIIWKGARPVFVDINLEDYTMDPDKIEKVITTKTRAIMPVHLYGQCADMAPILKVAQKYNLFVIEDAAQAHGAKYYGRRAGTLGTAAAFSFYPGKNLGAYGDAGIITTNDSNIAARVRRLRDHGRLSKYEHIEVGFSERLDTIQAVVLKVKLTKLSIWNDRRRKIAALYTSKLKDNKEIKVPIARDYNDHIYHQYVITTQKRDALAEYLKNQDIQTGVHYPIPLHLQPALRFLNYKKGDFPVTERLANEVLSLPMFPELTESEIDHITNLINKFFDLR